MYKNLIFEKKCNLKVYMLSRFCMHEHFDLIRNPFKYKHETSQVFIHPFQKLWGMQNASHEWCI
jgi:hypothetical protein